MPIPSSMTLTAEINFALTGGAMQGIPRTFRVRQEVPAGLLGRPDEMPDRDTATDEEMEEWFTEAGARVREWFAVAARRIATDAAREFNQSAVIELGEPVETIE